MDGPLRKLLSCHHIWLVNLSAWQVSACQLVSLSSYASLGACNLVFVHPKWEIGRQVDISPLLGHQLTAEKKQKITSTCRTLVGNRNESFIMILWSLTHIFRSKKSTFLPQKSHSLKSLFRHVKIYHNFVRCKKWVKTTVKGGVRIIKMEI